MSKPIYPQNCIIVIVGPTASGKSDLAVYLAKKFNGEVISADSRQIYKGMNIGTGKVPISYERSESTKSSIPSNDGIQMFYKNIRHHLLDVASPKRRFTAAQYKKLAQKAIADIQRRGKLPIVCGGTGFYIRALIDDLPIPEVKPDLKLRAKLERKTTAELFSQLQKLDPRRAKEIDRHNPRRLVRALEIIYKTGKTIPSLTSVIPAKAGIQVNSSLSVKGGWEGFSLEPGSRLKAGMTPKNNYTNLLFLGLSFSRPELAKRIKIRLQKRLKQGMIAEVKKLRTQGLSWKRLESFGLEYRWLAKFLQNKISYEEMTDRLQKDIEHYAKRQMTWFKRDSRINWVINQHQAEKIVKKFIK